MNSIRPRQSWLRLILLVVVLGVIGFCAGRTLVGRQSGNPVHPLTGRRVAGIASDARWMDRAEREQEEQPDLALDLIGIAPDMIAADIGAGSGYMTTRLARRVGPAGKVYANDIQPALLELLSNKVQREGLVNVTIVLGTEDDARLPTDAIDLALLVDVYHEFSQPQKMLQSVRRSLKRNARLVLIEYRKEDPNIPIAAAHRMSVAEVRTEVGAEGFLFDRVIEKLPRQHIIIFRR
jgi:ubiquinone/menaquinone biosynthesis C-methylase UbiE